MIRNLGQILSALTVALLLTGCVGTGAIPETRYYRLPAPHPAPLAHPVFAQPLGIPRLQAGGLLEERPILYYHPDSPLDLRPYHYHFWSDTPALLIRDHLIDYLLAARAATDIVRDHGEGRAPVRLYGRLIHLEREVSAARIVVHVMLEFSLEEDRDVRLPARRYEVHQAAEDRTLHATAQAFGTALEAIYARLLDDLRSLPR